MEAVVEPHFDAPSGLLSRSNDPLHLDRSDAGRLLDEDVATRRQRSARSIGQSVVGYRHHHDVGGEIEKFLKRAARHGTGLFGEPACRLPVDVERPHN